MDEFMLSLECRYMFNQLVSLFWQAFGHDDIQRRILALMDKIIALYPYDEN
jgi:hypothetical protein